MKSKKKIIILILLMLFLIVGIGILYYLLSYYEADNSVNDILNQDNVLKKDNYIKIDSDSDIAFIFYPGGKVEYIAYLPLLNKISESGIDVYLVKMPFNLAIFDSDAASKIIKNNQDINSWYIGGHSLGGVMASNEAVNSKVDGLILLGAYTNSNYSLDKTLTIYGENDLLMRDDITYDTNVFEIEGGNHAGFGNYGEQSGDGKLEITNTLQQQIAVEYIIDFIKKEEH